MVVKKVMRYPPWAPPAPTTAKKKNKVRLAVTRLEGLPSLREGEGEGEGGGGKVAAVEIKWKRPSRTGSLSYLMRRRRRPVRSISREKAVGNDGVVEWEEEDGDASICCFWNWELVSPSISDPNSMCPFDVSFSILYGFHDQQGGKENKLEEVGTTIVNLAEWASSCQSHKQGEGEDSQLQVQRKELPITIRMESLAWEATLYVTINFGEARTSKETKESAAAHGDEHMKDKQSQQEEQTSDEPGTDDSCIFNAEVYDLDQLLLLADEEDKLVDYSKRSHAASNSSGRSSPESGHTSKESFLSWRKRSKIANKSREIQDSSYLENMSSRSGMQKKEPSGSDQDDDPVGSWKGEEFISRDKETNLKTQVFFASIDQRDESAGGESACTALVAVIANALHSNGLNAPTRSEFDALIREGSSEWRKLCENVSYIDRFPNKHFDLDTILEANIKPISVLPEKSFIGFFQPESFESLHGAMSFDDIWQEITSNIGKGDPKVYIVSWNDHFFLLKMEANAYYIIDTLGERLFEGCNKAYILRFDDSTEMYRLPENSGTERGEELHCSGKDCCREFINRFLAAIPLREELEIEKKGMGTTNTALHQRLQIELHLTEAANQRVTNNVDWR